ncbi:Glycosyltransferase involved in cell wall bisynthesis [Maribacter dokdonensis]|uniref:glycosyltransferase family 2 protein n=1 Tax=Maribacter dokdonensis TaxID=320912 RepID=UPI001B0B5A0F|nr:glycosyltransferase family 2 protein [Maribacter dokdonensis]CAG2532200.1 Glycosyltransferase involved in cell wall bisynthesis [Maribacter dokdonensis]
MITKKEQLTALVITYNEIGFIEKCIESVSFADEIIVVDSFSTDGTYEFLKDHPKVKVIQNPFENFTAQKSFALKQAKNDWVLFLDADEVVTKSLKKEIVETISSKDTAVAYWFYRKFMYQKSPLHFSGWQTDKNYRLFRKSKVEFANNKIVHETLQVNGISKCLKQKLTHYCFKNYADYKSKMLKYGELRAQEELSNGKKFNYIKLVIKPTWKFIYNYIIRLGILDGKRGINVCYLNALSVFTRYSELHRLEGIVEKPVYSNLSNITEIELSSKRLAS